MNVRYFKTKCLKLNVSIFPHEFGLQFNLVMFFSSVSFVGSILIEYPMTLPFSFPKRVVLMDILTFILNLFASLSM